MMVKPTPVTVAEFTVAGDVPVDVKVNDWVVVVFTVMPPKLKLLALIVNCGFAATLVPLRVTVAVLPVEELLLIVSWPLAVPVAVAVGLNSISRVNEWFGSNVTGKL
jgi:hypothetical protein